MIKKMTNVLATLMTLGVSAEFVLNIFLTESLKHESLQKDFFFNYFFIVSNALQAFFRYQIELEYLFSKNFSMYVP